MTDKQINSNGRFLTMLFILGMTLAILLVLFAGSRLSAQTTSYQDSVYQESFDRGAPWYITTGEVKDVEEYHHSDYVVLDTIEGSYRVQIYYNDTESEPYTVIYRFYDNIMISVGIDYNKEYMKILNSYFYGDK